MQLKIEKLVYGGAGLARTDQGVVFVHRSAPGDVLEVELVDRKKDYATARIVRILEPSPDRQDPTCPNFQSAGCCHWQHILYARQVEHKKAILQETLHRAGKIDWDRDIESITGPDSGYRLRASFHVLDRKLGFMRERSNVIVPIERCAALTPELNAWIPEANKIITNQTEVHALAGDTIASTLTIPITSVNVGEYRFEVHAEGFFQSNRFLLQRFMDTVLDQCDSQPKHVLDLYCGSGFFSVPLAKRSTELIGIEYSRTAIKQAKRNAKLNGVENVNFVEGHVDSMLKDATIRPDLIVLDPPRTGAGRETTQKIAALKAPRIVYVSCNPSTFAREALLLRDKGYALRRITLIDQFPNTYHIELSGQFELT